MNNTFIHAYSGINNNIDNHNNSNHNNNNNKITIIMKPIFL